MTKKFRYTLIALAMTSLAGCGGGGGAGGVGQLKVAVADAPVDGATAVVVKFTGIEVKPRSGAAIQFTLPSPQSINLLQTASGQAALLLGNVSVPAGDYEYIRLAVVSDRNTTDSYIDLADGSRAPLFVPSGSESGLKLNGGLSVPEGGLRSVVVDFDLRHSIVKPTGQTSYTLKPVLRLLDADQLGLIKGSIASAKVTAAGCTGDVNTGAGNAVYVYSGNNVVPDDVGGSGANPIASATAKLDTTTGNYSYTVAYLIPGSYTAAFTCQAKGDNPEANDSTVFVAPTNLTVTAGNTSTVNF